MIFLKSKRKVRGASSKTRPSKTSFNLRKLLPFSITFLVLVVCFGLYQGGVILLSWPVERVLVSGEFRHVDKDIIVKQVQPFLKDGFVMLDLAGIRQQLLKHPWIFDASLTRFWPDQIKITVTEQTPIAHWGDEAYINHQGKIFKPDVHSNHSTKMPKLYGVDSSVEQVINHFTELNELLLQHELVLNQLILNDRGNWVAQLENGVVVMFGGGDVMDKAQRFLYSYKNGLSEQFNRVKTIDMR